MATNISDEPEYWRKRAEEARTYGAEIKDPHTMSLMMNIAATYEKLAEWFEERIRKPS